jgi:hypothetical protein
MPKRRPTLESLKARALKSPAVKAEYDALAPVYAAKRERLAKRLAKQRVEHVARGVPARGRAIFRASKA